MLLLISIISIPVTLVIIGLIMLARPPKKINHYVGYRTANSMKSQESWDYAQKMCARYMMLVGVFGVLLDLAICLPLYLKSSSHFEAAALILSFVDVLPLILLIFVVEQKLHKFNSNKN